MSTTESAAGLDIRVLGPTEVLRDGAAIDLPGGRARALLIILALKAGEAIPTERLIDMLWADAVPATARTVLQGFVSKLRRTLGPAVIETMGNSYRLAVPRNDIDAHRFQDLVAAAADADTRDGTALLREALSLWRGPALADVSYQPFTQAAIAALEDARQVARETLIRRHLDAGAGGQVVPELQDLIADDPYREHLRELLIVALYRAGRQADALAAYRQARETLVTDLGVEPGPELQALHERVLRQDPDLLPSGGRDLGTATTSPWFPSERRTVTIVSLDVTGGEELHDPEAGEIATEASIELATDALRDRGASLVEASGSGALVAWFGLTTGHDDDPLRAVLAVHDARAQLGSRPGPGRLRAGIESGEVVMGPQGIRGALASHAARLQHRAQQGDVLVGPQAMAVLRGSVVVEPHRESGAVAGWRLVHVDPDAELIARDLAGPMVGREAELARLRTGFGRTVRQRRPQSMIVLGEAGLGKTRLADAFASSVAGQAATILAGCDSAPRGATFGLLGQLFAQTGDGTGWGPVADLLDDRQPGLGRRLGAALGLSVPSGPTPLFGDVRRALEIFSEAQPLAVVVDDVHRAEAGVLDLFDYLGDSVSAPVFFLFLARPELVERRSDWSVAGQRRDLLYLDPLADESIALVVGRHGSLQPMAEQQIIETARGNPLFAEQLVAAVANGETDEIPASLRGLLTTRIDRLGPGERDLLRAAAVAGDHLSAAALAAVAPPEARPFLSRNLGSLVRKDLLKDERPGDVRFPHDLVRDAAYQSLTRRDRVQLHLAFAGWCDSQDRGSEKSHAVVGHHLEQAVVNQRRLGVAADAMLAARAGEELAAAGSQAMERWDMAAAADVLGRSLQMLPADHPLRTPVTQRLAEVSLPLGDHARAQELLLELSTMAQVDPVDRWLARLEYARSQCLTGPHAMTTDDVMARAHEALGFFGQRGHDVGIAQAHFLVGWLERRSGAPDRGLASGRASLQHAEIDATPREQLAAAVLIAESLIEGPTPVRVCIQELEALVRQHGAPNPIVMCSLARARAMALDVDSARALLDEAGRVILERMHVRRLVAFVAWARGDVETVAGRAQAAAVAYRAALRPFRSGHEAEHVATTSARLALALAAEGHHEEGLALASEAAASAPADCLVVRGLARMATARNLGRDSLDTSLALAAEAVSTSPPVMPNLTAELLVEQALVQRAAGLADDARASIDRASQLFQAKGNIAGLQRLE